MKCAYTYCKFGGNVDKEDAVKDKNRYWHKECHKEKELKNEIKNYYYDKFNSKEPIKNVNSAIKKYINDEKYDAGYVLYCLKHKAKNLNSIYGLIYTLSYRQNEKDYKKYVASKTEIIFDQDVSYDFIEENRSVVSKNTSKWGDLFE